MTMRNAVVNWYFSFKDESFVSMKTNLTAAFLDNIAILVRSILLILCLLSLVPPVIVHQSRLHDKMSGPLNVLKQPLALFSRSPMTGFHRDGYCRTGAMDHGNHAVAGIVSEEFLDYTASKGNDLRPVGLKDGCKWCLCASRWLEAVEAYKSGAISKNGVPKVDLGATNESALKKIDLDTLKHFASEPAANGK